MRNKELVLVPSENEDEDQEEMLASSGDPSYELFHATNEWKTIKKGQSIPPGLHVQIDLQTGQKQAKLMEEETIDRRLSQPQSWKHSRKQKFIKIDKNIISKQSLKDALKDFKDKFHNEDTVDELRADHGRMCCHH